MVGVVFLYVDTVYGFLWVFFFVCLVGCFSMIIWTPTVLSFICMCFVFLHLHCSAQLSMFHMQRRSRNMLIIIIKKYIDDNKGFYE